LADLGAMPAVGRACFSLWLEVGWLRFFLVDRSGWLMELPEFTQRVAAVLAARFPEEKFEVFPDQGLIVTPAWQLGLPNLYSEWRMALEAMTEAEFAQRVLKHFEQAVALVDDSSLVAPQWEAVRPRLRLQLANLQIPQFAAMVTFPFSHQVCSAIVIDSPQGYAYVSKVNLAAWGQTSVDLLEIAQRNSSEAVQNTKLMQVPAPDGGSMLFVQESDGYAAARVLLPSFREFLIENLAPQDGFVWVGVPNRDFLLAWSDQVSPTTKRTLAQQIAVDARQQHHPLCGVPLRVSRETIEPQE